MKCTKNTTYQVKSRLQSLKAEFEAGQKLAAELEAKQANLRTTLLRISGAIQVLEEIIAEQGDTVAAAPPDNGQVAPLTAAPASMPDLDTVADQS